MSGKPRKPRLNHVAMSVPRELLTKEGSQELLRFYHEVFGWDEMPGLAEEGQRYVLRLYQNDQFVFLVNDGDPMTCGRLDHFGLRVNTLEELSGVLERAKKFKEQDDRVEIIDHSIDEYPGVLKLHNTYIRYLLPMMVELQYYERDENAAENMPQSG